MSKKTSLAEVLQGWNLRSKTHLSKRVQTPHTCGEGTTDPAVAGKVTPLVLVRVPAVANTTVPPDDADTAIFPKLMSAFFEMLMGVTTVAVAVAVAVACAKEAELKPMIATTERTKRVFIFLVFEG